MGLFSNESDPNDKLEQLRNLVPLNALSDKDLERIHLHAKFETLKKGDYLFREGDKDHQHVYLLSGMVSLNFGVKEVDMVFSNSTTARFPIADGQPRKYTARAKKKCDIVRIDDRLLEKLLNKEAPPDYEVAHLGENEATDDWMSQLLRSPVFQKLPTDALQGVIQHMEEMPCKLGDKIILEGQVGDFFYLINKGRCLVTAEGKPDLRVELGPGACFGEEALLSGRARNASVTLLTEGKLLRLGKEFFHRFVRDPLDNGVSGDEAMEEVKKGAEWIDIRLDEEFQASHLPGGINIPAHELRNRAANELDKEKSYILYCDDGQRSRAAAFVMLELGFDAYYLRGGVSAGVQPKGGEVDLTRTGIHALQQRIEKVTGAAPTDFLNQLDQVKKALSGGVEGGKPKERGQMRDALLRLKQSLESKDAELAAARRDAEQALEMRGRLEQMEQVLQKGGAPSDLGQRLQQNTERIKQQIRSQEQQQGELKTELAQVLEKLQQMETQQAEVSNLEQELLAARQIREQAKQRIGDIEKRREATRTDFEKAVGRIQNLETQLSERQRAAATQAELETLRKELANAQTQREVAQKRIDDLHRLSQGSRSELDQSAQRIVALEQSLAQRAQQEKEQEEKYRATLDGLQRQLDESRRSQEESARQAKAVASEREQLNTELATMRQRMEQVEAQAGQAVAKLQQELEATHARLKQKGGGSTEEQAALQQRLQTLAQALKQQQGELQRSEQERAGLKEFLESRADELHSLKSALASAQTEAEQAASRRAEAEQARQKMEKEISRLQDEMVIARTQKEIAAAKLEEERTAPHPKGGANKGVIIGAAVGMAITAVAVYFVMTGGEIKRPPPILKPKPTPEQVVPAPESTTPPPVATIETPVVPEKQGSVEVFEQPGEPAMGTVMRDKLSSGGEAPELVYIRGGRFRMGNVYDVLTSDELPLHWVTLKSYAIGHFEVTFDDYDRFAKATGRRLPEDGGMGRGNKPVINVTWNDAAAYAEWLSQQTGKKYRLPSEAEWEYAARSGTDSPFWWGTEVEANRANCFNCGSKWDGKGTAPVGSFEPNLWGLHDTAGNVTEWVEDCYHQNYIGAPTDGTSWKIKNCKDRVVRGGAYNRPGQSMRSTKRTSLAQVDALPQNGFRVVRDVP